MSEQQLTHFYQQELAYLQRLMAEFAAQHPKIAGRLRISATTIEDPQVRHLLESYAFLNTRLQHKLHDDYPELSHALLEILAPHFLAPVPALSIVQLQLDQQTIIKKSIAKNTLLKVEAQDESVCYFSACHPVEVLPVQITAAQLCGLPFQAPALPKNLISTTKVSAILTINLKCYKSEPPWSNLDINHLRFYINPSTGAAYSVYELLLQHTVAIALANSPQDANAVFLDTDCLQPVGFAADEALLPYSSRVKSGQRLLMDYAILPEKFLFFELIGLASIIQQKFTKPGETLTIFFYLKQSHHALEKTLKADYFALGCIPIINLFPQSVKFIHPGALQTEYLLSVDTIDSTQEHEIYGIDRISVSHNNQPEINCIPFNSIQHGSAADSIYYHARRSPAWKAGIYDESASEILLSFSDQQLRPINLEKWHITAQLLVTNRDLPNQLKFAPDKINIQLEDPKDDTIKKIKCLLPFTTVKRPFLQPGACWRYISHLSPNYLILNSSAESCAALCDILQIYQLNQSQNFSNLTKGLLNINCGQTIARNPKPQQGNLMWHGLEIKIHIDQAHFANTSLLLFGSILERSFPSYCTYNSFTQLCITTTNNEFSYRWPLRAGEQAFI